MDSFQTIKYTSEGLFKDRGSRFISFAYRVSNQEEIKLILQDLRKKFYDARHHCYAYRLGLDKKVFRANDDGEPSSTAGKPILGQIVSKDLTNILIVVIRYFGGTLLGIGGLINAYRNGAISALENNEIITEIVKDKIQINFDYIDMNSVMKVLKDENLKPENPLYEMNCSFALNIRKKDTERILERLKKKVKTLKILFL